MENLYDLVIAGGGPAGVAAGVYAARKKLKTVLITDIFGGQSLVSDDIGNWLGEERISGFELAQKLEKHLKAQGGIEIVEGDLVTEIKEVGLPNINPIGPISPSDKNPISPISPIGRTEPISPISPIRPIGPVFRVETKNGKIFMTKTLLWTAGSRRKKLDVPGEKEFEGKGVAYCSTCDAPIFGGKVVAVVGGGNAGLEAVVDLLPYASKIYLIHRNIALKGDPVTQERIKREPRVEVILNAETKKIIGDKTVTGLEYKDKISGDINRISVDGVFVEIGIIPNGDLVKDLVSLNFRGEIIADPKTQATSLPGIWAAGDATDGLYRQNNISAGDAIKAVLNIYDFLRKS